MTFLMTSKNGEMFYKLQSIGLYHPLYGNNNPKYKLLLIITIQSIFILIKFSETQADQIV
jgi:hypothetical protein